MFHPRDDNLRVLFLVSPRLFILFLGCRKAVGESFSRLQLVFIVRC